MRMLKGVVKAVGKGKVTVLAENGSKFTTSHDGDLKNSEEVIVWFNYHNFTVENIQRAEDFRRQLAQSDEPDEPSIDPEETIIDDELDSESESSLLIHIEDGVSDFEDSDSESESSFQLFESEFGADPDELN